jgi:hypothetical protein
MSYSRWGNSRWYTFWSATDSDRREDQVFDVDCSFQFKYSELKKDRQACLRKVRAEYGELDKWELDEAYAELERYMLEFMKDVEDDDELE